MQLVIAPVQWRVMHVVFLIGKKSMLFSEPASLSKKLKSIGLIIVMSSSEVTSESLLLILVLSKAVMASSTRLSKNSVIAKISP